jgi:hypothetical protein
MLTVTRLQSALDYNPDTGVFTWKDAGRRTDLNGKVAGVDDGRGYLLIKIDQVYYKAHRLAWLYVTGEWPLGEIDHRNEIKGDNRFSNLREASRIQNAWNTGAHKNNTSGHKGVDLSYGKWRARIRVGSKRVNLGVFDSAEDASAAYERAAAQHHGNFAHSGS